MTRRSGGRDAHAFFGAACNCEAGPCPAKIEVPKTFSGITGGAAFLGLIRGRRAIGEPSGIIHLVY
jgi:hypothetical protein